MNTNGNQPVEPTDLLRIVYTPNDIARLTLRTVEQRIENKGQGLRANIATLDAILMPFFPGELIGIMGRPSNYKTGFMQFLARQFVSQVGASGKENEMVVYVTWEVSVEELGFYDLAHMVQLDAAQVWQGNVTEEALAKIRDAAMHRAAQPIWVIGHSLSRRRELRKLTLQSVHDALLTVETHMDFHPRAIFLDYLQEIDPGEGQDRRERMINNVEAAKQLARDCGCPVFMGVQAGRKVDERTFKLPQIGDGEETSRLEQSADKLIALWLPKNNLDIGDELPDAGWSVTENLLVLGLRKQRLGKSGQVLPLYVDAARNIIRPMDIHAVDLEPEGRRESAERDRSWKER